MMAAFMLAHLSDPHLPPLPAPRLSELMSKRALGYLNWTCNRHKYHRREALDALVADLKTQTPDHIAVTGDLTNLALPAEFAPAARWLQSVGSPADVTAIPGNHDAYVRATSRCFADVFADYVRSDTAEGGAKFPSLRRRGPLALISLSTAVPTPPLSATGTLGRAQLEALQALLESLAAEPLFRVILLHHPLRSKSQIKRLTDAADLLAVLRRHGVELILHGHDHIHSTNWIDGPDGRIPSIGVPSASALAHGRHPAAAYNLFAIEPLGNGWRCEQIVRGLDDKLRIVELNRVRLM
jgi:3',5'-cyclic AMP phosphodiesterase CpdA